MSIRKIKNSDLKQCSELLRSAYESKPYLEDFEKDYHFKYVESKYNLLKDTSFVIEESNEIAGFVFCSISYWSNGLQASIEEIVVGGKFQGRGYGKKLYDFAEEYLKEKGVKSILLWVQKDAIAYNFHKKNGFFESNEHAIMFKNL